MCYFFFFQAEDGIRDRDVTGVQTCALPISSSRVCRTRRVRRRGRDTRRRYSASSAANAAGLRLEARQAGSNAPTSAAVKIGRASCRERVESAGGGGS